MAQHNHTGSLTEPMFAIPFGPAPSLFQQYNIDPAVPSANLYYDTISYSGGGQPFNIIQPTTYVNYMIKL
jgi:hypothetical protein